MRSLRFLCALLLVLAAAPAWAADGESRFAGLDGFLIHYQSWGKTGAPAVILIHGYTLDQSTWRHQVPALARGHRVIALDLPGHGQSGRPRDVVYTLDLYARAVEAVARDAGITHAALVGHSLGLPVIHQVARHGVLKIDRAVFLDGAITERPIEPKAQAAHDTFAAAMVAGLNGPDYRLVLERFLKDMMVKLPPAEAKAILANLRDVDQHMAASTFAHVADADAWAPARYDFPVLALYAGASAAGVKDWLAAHYPRARLVVWDDVDHFLHLEQPARVSKALAEFLK